MLYRIHFFRLAAGSGIGRLNFSNGPTRFVDDPKFQNRIALTTSTIAAVGGIIGGFSGLTFLSERLNKSSIENAVSSANIVSLEKTQAINVTALKELLAEKEKVSGAEQRASDAKNKLLLGMAVVTLLSITLASSGFILFLKK